MLVSAWCSAQNIAQVDLQAIAELEILVVEHDDPKSLLQATGAYPVAEVHGKATVGFLGRLNGLVSESDWLVWAANEEAVTAGACRQGIASFRVDAYSLEILWQTPMQLIELASRAGKHNYHMFLHMTSQVHSFVTRNKLVRESKPWID